MLVCFNISALFRAFSTAFFFWVFHFFHSEAKHDDEGQNAPRKVFLRIFIYLLFILWIRTFKWCTGDGNGNGNGMVVYILFGVFIHPTTNATYFFFFSRLLVSLQVKLANSSWQIRINYSIIIIIMIVINIIAIQIAHFSLARSPIAVCLWLFRCSYQIALFCATKWLPPPVSLRIHVFPMNFWWSFSSNWTWT